MFTDSNKIHISSAGISDIVDVLVDSSTSIPDEIHIHKENQDSQETEVDYIPIISSSSQSFEFLAMVR